MTSDYCVELPIIGPNDLKLAKKLIKAGREHRKFLRQIQIWMDITIPRYVWTELDTYKVSTVRNSCSTMHKLGHRDLEYNDFEGSMIREDVLNFLNERAKEMRQARVIRDSARANQLLRILKANLPESFLQKATYSMNYETALSMYWQRRSHRLVEWNEKYEGSICWTLKQLPYMKDFIEATATEIVETE